MPEQLLTILKLCLLALLYLFFLRVLRAVWTEMNPPKLTPGGTPAPTAATPVTPRMPKAPKAPSRKKVAAPTVLVATEPVSRAGTQWSLSNELVVGRHAGCSVVLDEQFVSQQHAKFFVRGDTAFVEDIGSTNGTWVNGERATGQRPVRLGDRVQIGNVVLEVR